MLKRSALVSLAVAGVLGGMQSELYGHAYPNPNPEPARPKKMTPERESRLKKRRAAKRARKINRRTRG